MPKKITKKLDKLNGISIIGHFVWWSIQGARIERDKFKKLVEKSGLDFKVPDVCLRTAFLQAKREIRAAEKGKKILVRDIKKGDEHVIGLVDETIREETRRLGYNHSATMVFNQDTHVLSCDAQHRAFDEIKKLYEDYKINMTSYDLRQIIMKIIKKLQNVMVREKGGIYFVPHKHTDTVLKLEWLLDQIPGDCSLEIAPQIDSEKTKKVIYRAFISDLHAKIDKFKGQLEDEKFTSNKGWRSRLKEFKEMREKISFYSDALKFGAEDIDNKLQKLSKEIKKKLTE